MNTMLHAEVTGDLFHRIFEEVIVHGFLDTIKIIPFFFVTYLIIEFIDRKASAKVRELSSRAGRLGPLAGGLVGAVPQCGFSAAASDLYRGRIITLGTLIAIVLSTSDEMLPLMISGRMPIKYILLILAYKAVVAIIIGFAVDLVIRRPLNIGETKREVCTCGECGCGGVGSIFKTALWHTVTVGCFVLMSTLVINLLVMLIGDDALRTVMYDRPFVSHLIAALVGLIPNCAASVTLTSLHLEGYITVGTMLAGLFPGAGVGILVLFRVNRRLKENLAIVGILVAVGIIFGMLADILNFSALV